MNLIALLAGVLPWAATPVSAFTRIYLACSLLSVEAQLITWLGRGTLDSLVPVNVAIALVLAGLQIKARTPVGRWVAATGRVLPISVVVATLVVVAALNLWRPVEAADQYQLDRVLHIQRVGTLAYSPDLAPKANIITAFYELILADVGNVPLLGSSLVRLHGVFGLVVFALAVGATREWLPVTSPWASALVFTVPVVFNQLILIKNDLFIGAPAFVVLAWAVGTPAVSSLARVFWAGWLVGLVAAAKLTNMALAVVIAAVVYWRRRSSTSMATVGAGVAVGMVAGGLALMLWQNSVWYGDLLASQQVEDIGSLNRSARAAVVGLVRFVLSLFDLGLVTRDVWPGRGGWGGTLGLPFVWATAILIATWRLLPEVRRAAAVTLFCVVTLGLTFPDADIAHRLWLGPGLLVIATGAFASRALEAKWVSRSLVLVVSLSALQILRSALLYATRI